MVPRYGPSTSPNLLASTNLTKLGSWSARRSPLSLPAAPPRGGRCAHGSESSPLKRARDESRAVKYGFLSTNMGWGRHFRP
eukprot:scaffold46434_cov21-Tisochrysis_lutea.AAC.1